MLSTKCVYKSYIFKIYCCDAGKTKVDRETYIFK